MRSAAKLEKEAAERDRAEARDAIARADAAERVAEATSAARVLGLAEDAAKAALDGRIEEARQGFLPGTLDGTTNLRVLSLGAEFSKRIGELAEAERLLRRSLAISGPDVQDRLDRRRLQPSRGRLQSRGDLDGAEALYRKALDIDEKLGRLEGMASVQPTSGVV